MQRHTPRKSKNNNKKFIWIGAVAIGLIYLGGTFHYRTSNKFMPNTIIDNVNVAGKSINQAQQTLDQHLENQTFNLTENDKTVEKVTFAKAGLTHSDSKNLSQKLASQNAWKWPIQLLHITSAKSSIKVNLDATSKTKLNSFAKEMASKLNQNRNTGSSSALSITDIIDNKHDYDDIISAKMLAQEIKSDISKGQNNIDLESTYQSASSNEATIKKQVQKILNEKITYNINGTKVIVPAKTIKKWLTLTVNLDGSQTVSVDQTQIKTYLDGLNDKHATYGADITFNSTKRGSQTVANKIFGWTIDTTTDAANLSQKILNGKNFTQSATISGSGTSLKKGELGSTYVEVDKTNQHMWYYEDGKLVISTDVVTGKPSDGDATPTGVYFVWNKERNATLKGKNSDGSKYASPVSYWMPIDYTGVGLHDANWQPKFGGDWYKTHGSHGCVNTPPTTMKKVYADVALGTPVIVF